MNQCADNVYVQRIVYQYSDMIIRIAFQHTRNYAEAEDIMQEVFLSFIKHPDFNDNEHIKAWLIRVTINKCKNYLKSAKTKTAALDENGLILKPEYDNVVDELQKLKEEDRNTIYLFYYEGYSAKEIAKILGKSENAVFTQLSRARDRLKNILEEEQ